MWQEGAQQMLSVPPPTVSPWMPGPPMVFLSVRLRSSLTLYMQGGGAGRLTVSAPGVEIFRNHSPFSQKCSAGAPQDLCYRVS